MLAGYGNNISAYNLSFINFIAEFGGAFYSN